MDNKQKVAMYFCQANLDATLSDIAAHFNLGHRGSVSFITHRVRKRRLQDSDFERELDIVFESIMNQVTCPIFLLRIITEWFLCEYFSIGRI